MVHIRINLLLIVLNPVEIFNGKITTFITIRLVKEFIHALHPLRTVVLRKAQAIYKTNNKDNYNVVSYKVDSMEQSIL